MTALRPASFSGSYPWDSMPAPVTGEIHYPATNRTGCDAFDGAEAAAMAGQVAARLAIGARRPEFLVFPAVPR